jgi:hypothetical protein
MMIFYNAICVPGVNRERRFFLLRCTYAVVLPAAVERSRKIAAREAGERTLIDRRGRLNTLPSGPAGILNLRRQIWEFRFRSDQNLSFLFSPGKPDHDSGKNTGLLNSFYVPIDLRDPNIDLYST